MKIIILILLCFMLVGCSNNAEIIISNQTEIIETEKIVVEIKGAVKFPGLYSLEKGMMLYELLNLAGGLSNNADSTQINLVQVFNNNTSIMIPYKTGISDSQKLININTASLEELMTLNGIGETKAKAIISYRAENSFTSIEDIKKVSGIGEEVFSKIEDNITV